LLPTSIPKQNYSTFALVPATPSLHHSLK
jgi:hypothetical protein